MENTDPIQYPKILLDGESVEVKFRCGDLIRLKKDGVDIGAMGEVKGVDAIERTLKLLSAGIAHHVKKSTEDLADLVDLVDFPKVAAAINEALKKATPQATTPEATTSIQ